MPFTSDLAGPSSILSSTSSNSCDSLVLNITEGVQVTCLRGGSPGSRKEMQPTEMFLATASGFSNGMKTSFDEGSFEDEIPQEAHFSDSEENVTDVGGNSEIVLDNMHRTSIESCNERSSLSCWMGPRASPVLAESNSGISSTSNSAFHSLLAGHEGLIIGVGNQVLLQHNSIEHDKQTIGSSNPVSDGLASDFLARHSQDRSIQQSLYRDDRGLIGASERSYLRATCASSCKRLGGAFSDVSSGGSAARPGFSGTRFHNQSSCSSSTRNTAAPLPCFTGQTHFPSVCNRVSSDGGNTSNHLFPRNNFANSDHSLTGEQDFNREWDSLLNQNFHSRWLSLQQINSPIPPNSRFVYGSTSSDFAPGIHSGYSMYGAQRHVLSDDNSALIVDQRSHHSDLNLESQSSQIGDMEQAEGSFAANGVAVGFLSGIVPSL